MGFKDLLGTKQTIYFRLFAYGNKLKMHQWHRKNCSLCLCFIKDNCYKQQNVKPPSFKWSESSKKWKKVLL